MATGAASGQARKIRAGPNPLLTDAWLEHHGTAASGVCAALFSWRRCHAVPLWTWCPLMASFHAEAPTAGCVPVRGVRRRSFTADRVAAVVKILARHVSYRGPRNSCRNTNSCVYGIPIGVIKMFLEGSYLIVAVPACASSSARAWILCPARPATGLGPTFDNRGVRVYLDLAPSMRASHPDVRCRPTADWLPPSVTLTLVWS